jgi:hypothetical protein
MGGGPRIVEAAKDQAASERCSTPKSNLDQLPPKPVAKKTKRISTAESAG